MIPELEKELINSERPFYMYKCGHLSEGSYPEHGELPVGKHANILICKTCWQNLKNMFVADFLKDMIKQNPDDLMWIMLNAVVDRLDGNGR